MTMTMLFLIFGLSVLWFVTWVNQRKIIIYEYEQAVHFKKGLYIQTLSPGRYFNFSMDSKVQKIDMRSRMMSISGQDVLSADGVTLRTTLIVEYSVTDAKQAITGAENYQTNLYAMVQLILRELISQYAIEDLLRNRAQLNSVLSDQSKSKGQEFGVNIERVSIKDMMFSGDLKKIFSQVIKARHEGLALLEKARGETAALRHLANAAKMIENNPSLLKLKMLESSGNTLVFGLKDIFAKE
ncbi:MAG: slipin family protein [Candidatus Omnitrophica bacterium]|nr:slipin family protein [Candidatus Omnitrophota bacterium]